MSLVSSLLVAAAVAGTLEISDRSEIRLRDASDAATRVIDLETVPAATLHLRARGWELTLGYALRLAAREINVVPQPEILHHVALAATFRFHRVELGAVGDASYGTQSFTSLILEPSPTSGPTPVERLPQGGTIDYLSSLVGVWTRYHPTRRWTLGARLEYALSGGVDAPSRAIVPFQHGPHAALDADHALTRKDHLVTTLDATQVAFSSGPDDTVIEATETWRHAASRRTESTLSGGVAVALWRGAGAVPFTGRVYPALGAALVHRIPPHRLETRFSLGLAPAVDRLSARVDQRLNAAAAVVWGAARDVTMHGQLGLAQSLPWTDDGAVTVGLGEAGVSLRLSARVRLELGTRGAWQAQRGAGALTWQSMLFGGATFAAPPLRF